MSQIPASLHSRIFILHNSIQKNVVRIITSKELAELTINNLITRINYLQTVAADDTFVDSFLIVHLKKCGELNMHSIFVEVVFFLNSAAAMI